MRAARLESRLYELGLLPSFSRPRVSNDHPYSESVFRTAKYRPDYPRRPFASAEEACLWVASFVDWYNHRHRHSGIKFVTPHQRHNGEALEICLHRTVIYEQARQRHRRRWSPSILSWRQPEEVWINPPPPAIETQRPSFAIAARSSAGASSFLAVTDHGYQTGSRTPWRICSSGMDLRQLIRSRSVSAETLSSTRRRRFRRPQPMLTAPARTPVTDFESSLRSRERWKGIA
jgi:hypothetical protein